MVPFIFFLLIFFQKNITFQNIGIFICSKGKKTMRELLFILCIYLWVAEYRNVKRSVPIIVDDITSLFKDIAIVTAKGLGYLVGKLIKHLNIKK